MPENNGRTIHSWLQHIDRKLDALHNKLDHKAETSQVNALEKRTRHLEVKQVGMGMPQDLLIF